ncbi:MAG: trimeric intracellular cation channel family protein [Rhizobiaceae bacterium]
MTLLGALDLAGVAVFAATGALAASRKQLDIIGFLFLASLTGIGGGTLRDVIIGATPIFWAHDSLPLAVCALTAIILYFAAPLFEYRYRLLLWLDAAGLAAYCVIGAQKGLEAGVSPLAAIVTGMVTATAGGMLRDLVSGEPSVLLRREIYITAALAGAGVFVLMSRFAVEPAVSAACAVLFAFAIRGGALLFGWTLPGYRHRPGRPAGDF